MLKLVALFRVGTYLTLALATLCLGLAERDQIQGGLAYYLGISLAILVAYLVEGRWVMPRTVANLLALFILLSWVAWFQFSLSGVAAGADDGGGDLLRLALPRVGPLLAALLLAKLFRPKTAGDYWLMYLLALIQVVLACVLALSSRLDRENLLFGGVLGLYLVSSVWTMSLFYLYRENLRLAPAKAPGGSVKQIADARARTPWRGAGVAQSVAWFAGAGAIALALFFAMPRLSHDAAASLVVPGSGQAATGFNPSMDLNNTGPLEVNDEKVMSVEVRDPDGRTVNLGGDTRFRGVTCSVYERGQWRPRSMMDKRGVQWQGAPPEGGVAYSLTYDIDLVKLRTARVVSNDLSENPNQPVFLAEPLFTPAGFPPIRVEAGRGDPTRHGLVYRQVEPALLAPGYRRSRNLKYTQSYLSNPADLSIWSQRVPNLFDLDVYDLNLRSLSPGLAQAGRIAAESRRVLEQAKVSAGASREQKARALENYLATSPQFGYSLDWRRADPTLDPTEDFLLNVKQGHCELFASALALMLRSQGIPARVIIGFRGAEWNDLAGLHEVRQYHAHAWVEARLSEKESEITIRDRIREPVKVQDWTWLTLDPTPAGGTAGALGLDRGRWDDEIHFLQFLWESFILDYSGENEQQKLIDRLSKIEWLRAPWSFFADQKTLNRVFTLSVILAVLLAVAWVLAKRRRKQAAPEADVIRVAFYATLLKLLERVSLRPVLGQTPAEFASVVATALTPRLPAADLADVPRRVIEQFYAVRFGGHDLDAAEAADIDRELTRLGQALRA